MDVEWSAMPLLHLKRWQCPHRLTEHSLLAAQAFHPTSCSQHAFVPSMKSFLFPHFIGTAHKIMFWSGKWLQTCLEGQAETQRKIWVFSSLLCSGTWTPKEALGILRDHSSQICCNLHWKFRGKISKIENLSLYFAAYTGDEQFWVSGNILLMAGQEKNPVKVKNPVKRSNTPHWGAVYPERTGVSPCHPELPHTPTWLWEETPVKFLEFLQWVGALVFLQATYKWEKRSSEAKWNQSFTTEAC